LAANEHSLITAFVTIADTSIVPGRTLNGTEEPQLQWTVTVHHPAGVFPFGVAIKAAQGLSLTFLVQVSVVHGI
jgi:hypothetical protein